MMNIKATAAHLRDTFPMSVDNMTFLVNRLGEDCAPLQFVRELTQNGLEAIRLCGKEGSVVWDVDWNYFSLMNRVTKLACIDTGVGMTGPEMVQHINALSSSIHQQSASGNFGVGAKIAAVSRNPHGLVYMSWKGGVGHMIQLWFDTEEEVYGLKRWPNGEFWTPVSNACKPKEIRSHGTMVVLLGNSDDEDTMTPPAGTPMRSRWILRYLNTRYFKFPEGIQVKAREGWDLPRTDTRHNFLRVVEGQGVWLDKNAESKGIVVLTDAKAHWWILAASVDRDSGHVAPGGHAAALYQNELYEMVVGRAGIARLQAFGVIFGTDRVAIYVEPVAGNSLSANTARTQLLIAGEPLDWQRWAAEFREAMPDALTELQEQIGSKAGEKDHKKAIMERLKQIRDLLRFSRFRPNADGKVPVDEDVVGQGVSIAPIVSKRANTRESPKKVGRASDVYALYAESGTTNADPVNSLNEPKTQWVSVDDGTRAPPDLDDRAAKFLVQQNLLMINSDFCVFTDMIDRWNGAYSHIPGADSTVKEAVHEWFEQQLIEAVMSAQALKNTGKWSLQELESLWDEAALTATVLPRWHIDQSVRRNLGGRLGSLKQST
jgi:hypothetical protein